MMSLRTWNAMLPERGPGARCSREGSVGDLGAGLTASRPQRRQLACRASQAAIAW